jgi:hypothetical protein
MTLIVTKAAAAGVRFRLVDGRVFMDSDLEPSADLLAEIKAHKAEIVAHLQSAERFVAAVQTIFPGARVVTEAEKIKDAQREVLTFVREDKARRRADGGIR